MCDMVSTECEVTVLCTTYNQSQYLRRALDSILSQITDFSFEIVIHDDVSDDGTAEIIKEYERRYPDRVTAVFEEENQYSKGMDYIFKVINEHARGRYIALCEGDDFWTDNNKLQIQRDTLERHSECDMCACLGCTVTEDGDTEVSRISPRDDDGILPLQDVIMGGGQYLVTAGLFFRKEMCDDMYGLDSLDYSLQMRGALRGGIYYIHRNMAVYRRYAKGSWTNNVLKKEDALTKQWEKERRLLDAFDSHTGYRFHEVIEERMKSYTPFDVQLRERETDINNVMISYKLPCFIWGRGRRGTSLERYCDIHGYRIDGICDAIDTDIGEYSENNNLIYKTSDVLAKAKTILASNDFAYKDLSAMELDIQLINFQQFMPYG